MIGILSWGAHKTLVNTLESYERFELNKLDDERVIFFQQFNQHRDEFGLDEEIADRYGWDSFGAKENIGISQGYKRLVESATSDLFLFLEMDWMLLESPTYQIETARDMLRNYAADVVRFRHRKFPGNPLWTRQFQFNELTRPEHLLDSMHWIERPDVMFFPRIYSLNNGFYATLAKYANWTNNPHMARVGWLKQNILPRISGDIERNLQDWWQKQEFIVAQGEGLFTHLRID